MLILIAFLLFAVAWGVAARILWRLGEAGLSRRDREALEQIKRYGKATSVKRSPPGKA